MSARRTLCVVRVSFREACDYIARIHRHHKPPQGHVFSIGAMVGGELVGVAIVGRPVARMLDDGRTAEVTRLATDGTDNACSFLYGAAWRAARALGFRKIITYILHTEPGTSLRAAGWTLVGEAGGGSWNRVSRPRRDVNPTQGKMRYEKSNTTPQGRGLEVDGGAE